jgi:hypothetical protein
MSDKEAHDANGMVPDVAPRASRASTIPPSQPTRLATNQNSHGSSDTDDEEQAGLYDLAEELRSREPPVEPWFLEMSRLRRIYILWLNKQLSLCRKSILGRQRARDEDMEVLGKVLHLQGKTFDGRFEPTND